MHQQDLMKSEETKPAIKPDMFLICEQCDRIIEPDYTFCPGCGKSIKWEEL